MSLSRSPSPHPENGDEWASPTVTAVSGSSTPHSNTSSGLLTPNSLGSSGVSWAEAKAKSDEVRKYPSFSAKRYGGFFSRSRRRMYSSLPRFRTDLPGGHYVDKDEFGRGIKHYSYKQGRGLVRSFRSLLWRRKLRTLLGLILAFFGFCFFWTCK